jgi:hypothetical protein
MNKFKLSLALFAAYFAGELVTTAMQFRKLNKALDDGVLFTEDSVENLKGVWYRKGAVDALDDKEAVAQAMDRHIRSSMILDYTNV